MSEFVIRETISTAGMRTIGERVPIDTNHHMPLQAQGWTLLGVVEKAAIGPCHRADYGWQGDCANIQDSGPDMHYACGRCIARAFLKELAGQANDSVISMMNLHNGLSAQRCNHMTELFTITPLEWEEKRGNPMWTTEPLPGLRYEVGWIGNSAFAWCARVNDKQIECTLSPETAKQIAEQHWLNHIKQALIPVDGPQPKETKQMDNEQNIDELDAERIERIEIEDGRRCGECGSTEMGHCVYCKMD